MAEMQRNPYAAPQTNCLHEDELATVLYRAVLIFRRMGWGGLLIFGGVAFIDIAINLSRYNVVFLVQSTVLCCYAAFFWSILKTAGHLEENFETSYRRARWIAIIGGAFFFPLLTLPCYFAICHLEEYRRRSQTEIHDDATIRPSPSLRLPD